MSSSYTISVTTGGGRYASTDANVYISLYGSEGSVEKVSLKKEGVDTFERKQTDVFNIKTPKLGFVHTIKLGHDGTGKSSSWFVNTVKVKDDKTLLESTFTFRRWFSSRRGLEHEATQSGCPIVEMLPDEENSKLHHTHKFKTKADSNDKEDTSVILRRGQTFKVRLSLYRPLVPTDNFHFVLKTGRRPKVSDKSLVNVEKCSQKEFDSCKSAGTKWGFYIVQESPKELLVEVYIPANALPASYDVSIENDDDFFYDFPSKIIILFNPWCKDDEVYMSSEDDRNEYVMNQHGIVYQGSWRRPYPCEWYFGQFEKISLETVLYLLDRVKPKGRDSAVEVSRVLSAKGNSFDNNGVLEGNWTGDFSGGKRPGFWKTTPAILELYMKTRDSVKYGQCWVFSAVMTTLLRAIGIPCRSVTNFASAHDSDANCTNDIYLDSEGNVDDDKTYDSVWNFHVWNDAWMKRKDLEGDYDGWQAVDATPQEESEGLYQMGPSPLNAIKRGEVDAVYDTKFVFAEVNAETLQWQRPEGDSEYKVVYRSSTRVGRSISTKAVGKPYRNDVTSEYKYPEKSALERAAVRTALRLVDHPVVEDIKQVLKLNLEPAKEDFYAGQSVDVNIKVQNTSNEDQAVNINWKVAVVRYDGVTVARIMKDKRKVKIKKNTENPLVITIPADKYVDHLIGEDFLRVEATAVIPGTREIAVDIESIDLLKPAIKMDLPRNAKSGKEIKVRINFDNPLKKDLTECEAYIDGTAILSRIWDFEIQNIPAGGKLDKTYTVIPDPVGGKLKKRSIMFSFSCKQLGGFNVMKKLEISD